MPGYIIVEVRDEDRNVKIESATVVAVAGHLVVRKVSGGIYFGHGSDGKHTLKTSAPDYAELFKRVNIDGGVNQKIIHLKHL
jgi:hypothetical protein